jgi:hypothetical protein
MLTSTNFNTIAVVSILLVMGGVNVTEVSPTEYTQSGNDHFLAYIPSLERVGLHANPLSLYRVRTIN